MLPCTSELPLPPWLPLYKAKLFPLGPCRTQALRRLMISPKDFKGGFRVPEGVSRATISPLPKGHKDKSLELYWPGWWDELQRQMLIGPISQMHPRHSLTPGCDQAFVTDWVWDFHGVSRLRHSWVQGTWFHPLVESKSWTLKYTTKTRSTPNKIKQHFLVFKKRKS